MPKQNKVEKNSETAQYECTCGWSGDKFNPHPHKDNGPDSLRELLTW